MKLTQLKDLSVLKNNTLEYNGDMSKYQQRGKKQYQNLNLNQYQSLLYKRALYGISVYEEKEVKKMHWEKKRRITKLNRKAQSSLNIFKQEVVNGLCIKLLSNTFYKSNLVKNLFSLENSVTDPKFMNTLDLRDLGITKHHIIHRFVNEGILPKDFYKLKELL